MRWTKWSSAAPVGLTTLHRRCAAPLRPPFSPFTDALENPLRRQSEVGVRDYFRVSTMCWFGVKVSHGRRVRSRGEVLLQS